MSVEQPSPQPEEEQSSFTPSVEADAAEAQSLPADVQAARENIESSDAPAIAVPNSESSQESANVMADLQEKRREAARAAEEAAKEQFQGESPLVPPPQQERDAA